MGMSEERPAPPETIDPAKLVALQREAARVKLDASLAAYLQAIVQATRQSPHLSLGASTRGALALASGAKARALLRDRDYCIADDIQELAVFVLAHRVRLAAHSEGFVPSREESESVLADIVGRIPVPL
jgi:MoxR-like ATPase